MSTTAAIYQDASVAGDEATTFAPFIPDIDKMGQSFNLWDVKSSNMTTVEGNQFDDTFQSHTASDLPRDLDPCGTVDLLSVATDPLA